MLGYLPENGETLNAINASIKLVVTYFSTMPNYCITIKDVFNAFA